MTATIPATQSREELRFPADFWWGAATAAYQIEGAVDEDGRTPCIWDTFAATPGKTAGGDSGARATEHYLRYQQDVALMAQLGLQAYRFSVAWPRVRPNGGDRCNPGGLAFYDRLVDELLSNGIKPVATLYHWDLPQALEDAGGWPNRDTAYRFADFAADVAGAIGDRVQLWCTLNEPWCSAFLGYGSGVHAPGRTDHRDSLAAAHHLLLAHGLSVQAIRAASAEPAPVSFAINAGVVRPVSQRPEDVDAARRIDGLLNRIFLDPVLRGAYPRDVMADTARITDWSFVRDGDLAVISQPIDALGLNYYQPDLVGAAAEPGDEHGPYPTGEKVKWYPHELPVTDMGWPIDPSGLEEVLLRIKRDYGDLALYITENGAAFPDRITATGQVEDHDRIDFLRKHLTAAHRALNSGANLRGYFVWSLLDNYEWAMGYGKRFGIIHVDYETQVRTLKNSAHWYRDVIAGGGLVPA